MPIAIMIDDNVIVDRTQIIGTRFVVWKAWKQTGKSTSIWPHHQGFHTLTHFNGVQYGRMGTEIYTGYRGPDRQREWDAMIEHKVAITRAAHAAILRGMPKIAAKRVTFDDNGTIEMEV